MLRKAIKKAISIIIVSSLILCNICTSKVISASGTATGMIFAATGMTSTATYKASEKFIQGKDVSFAEATTDIANVGYAGYIIGNIVSIGATILNEYTGIIDKGINYFDNLDKNSNLSTNMNIANVNSAAKTCENFSNNVRKDEVDFYVRPNGEVIPSRGYRYLPQGSEKAIEVANTMTIPAQTGNEPKDVTYFSFDKYDVANPDALQVPHDASIKASFDTKQILDDIHIPKEYWNNGNKLEPFTKSYPDYGSGGATQAITKSKIKLDEVVQLPKIK